MGRRGGEGLRYELFGSGLRGVGRESQVRSVQGKGGGEGYVDGGRRLG